jgi:membrane protein YqaA with SNARE-associated domain
MNTKSLSNQCFIYGWRKRRLKFFYSFFSILILTILLSIFILFFDGISIFRESFIWKTINLIWKEIYSLSYLGIFFVGLFGGLFFITLPLEILFINSILKTTEIAGEVVPVNNPFILFLLILVGLSISYTFNYLMGKYFAEFAKQLVSIKKFYQLKSLINRRGSIAIFFISVIGLGSQQLTFIMGVFNYNKTRLIILTTTGVSLRFLALLIIFTLI